MHGFRHNIFFSISREGVMVLSVVRALQMVYSYGFLGGLPKLHIRVAMTLCDNNPTQFKHKQGILSHQSSKPVHQDMCRNSGCRRWKEKNCTKTHTIVTFHTRHVMASLMRCSYNFAQLLLSLTFRFLRTLVANGRRVSTLWGYKIQLFPLASMAELTTGKRVAMNRACTIELLCPLITKHGVATNCLDWSSSYSTTRRRCEIKVWSAAAVRIDKQPIRYHLETLVAILSVPMMNLQPNKTFHRSEQHTDEKEGAV